MGTPDVGAALVTIHWMGMLLGIGTGIVADSLGIRMMLSTRRGPSGHAFHRLHLAVGMALIAVLFSGTGMIVLRADRWCDLPDNVLRIGSICLPFKLATKLMLMTCLLTAAFLIDAFLLPLTRRVQRPLLAYLSTREIATAAFIGSASATCWLSLAAIPFLPALHSWPPLQLFGAIVVLWVMAATCAACGLCVVRGRLRERAEAPAAVTAPRDSAASIFPRIIRLTPAATAAATPFAGATIAGARRVSQASPAQPPVHAAEHADARPPVAEAASLGAALASCRLSLLGVLGISLVVNILMLTGPLYMLQVYDRVLTSRSVETLTVLTVLVLGLFAVVASLDMIRSQILARISVRLDRKLARPLQAAAIKVTAQRRRPAQSPLRDLDVVRQFFEGPAATAILDLPWAVLYFGVVYLLHPVLALLTLAGAIVLVVISIANQLLMRKPLSLVTESAGKADALIESGWRGAETLRALGMTEAFRGRWLDWHHRKVSAQLRANDISSTTGSTTRTARMLLQSLLLGTGAYLSLQETMSPGAMIAVSIIAARALAPIEQIVAQWRSIHGAHAAALRCKEALASAPQPSRSMPLPRPSGDLVVSKLFVTALGGTEPVLKGLDFSLSPGDALAVLGPSGAGKSTLARSLVGVWPVRHGEIRLDGGVLTQRDADELGRLIGYLPQDAMLFDCSIAENIARLAYRPDPHAVIAAAKAAGVHDMILRLPEGYATQVGEGGAALAGGQKQRIALARALYGDPALVVMDEPNANLDAIGEAALATAITALRKAGRIVVIVAHRRNVLTAVNRLLVLNEGRQIAFGPPAEVLRTKSTPAKKEATHDASVVQLSRAH